MTKKHAQKIYTALGLMSGTSLDGIDAALLETDGYTYIRPIGFYTAPYDHELRAKLRACLGEENRHKPEVLATERTMTIAHINAVHALLKKAGYTAGQIDLIGFHGQTIFHDASAGKTIQIGDGALLASETGINTVNDLRSADVENGGQGAPLLPLYHAARAQADQVGSPLAILNIGGVANVTYIAGPHRHPGEDRNFSETIKIPAFAGTTPILAFDTGPGCALIDDFMQARTSRPYDEDGLTARRGQARQDILDKELSLPYFSAPPPKSLDRESFKKPDALRGAGLFHILPDLSTEDGAATLTEFTIQSIIKAQEHLPDTPEKWLVTGGGRHNAYIMERLQTSLGTIVAPVEDVGWNGDAVEAEGFAYLAVRSHLGEPLSLPTTTGVRQPQTGGIFYKAAGQQKHAI